MTGSPTSLFRGQTVPFAGAPEAVARTFLLKHTNLFKVRSGLFNLEHVRTVKRGGVNYVRFRQVHQSVPIEGAEYIVQIGSDRRVRMVNGRYHPGEIAVSTRPSLTQTDAFNIAKQDFGANAGLSLERHKLVVFPQKTQFKLAWKLNLLTKEPPVSWEYFVDAMDGHVLLKQDVTMRVTGKGNVYLNFPDGTQFSLSRNVDLPRMDTSGFARGDYADVTNSTSRVQRPDYNFTDLEPDNNSFDEINVYFHMDKFRFEYINDFGFNLFSQIKAVVNLPGQGAAFNTIDNQLEFYHDNPSLPYFSMEAQIFYHECTHGVVYTINGLKSPDNESGAVNEGVADYFAGSYLIDPVIGQYVNVVPRGYRDMTNPLVHTYQDYIDYIGNDKKWAGGEFFSHILWALRSSLGPSTVDQIVFNALDNVNNQVNFLGYRDAMLDF